MKSIGTQTITTERLKLRRFHIRDVEAVFNNYGSDINVNRYISFAPCSTLESAKEFIEMHIKQYDSNPDFYGWAIILKDKVIGSIGLFNVEKSGQCELGYSIGSAWWGYGYATEAAAAVLEFAFQKMQVHRVYASHHIENLASGKVLEKIGMHYEGTMGDAQKNQDGTNSDLKLYAVLSTDL
ncbi:GNAT family N-acetyltransferase [Blautia producta]|uniref:GNAT family N-acetyltransferase n=1 Tax=Blautia producta TaxID=33035 RepID=UPI0035623CBF